jgi:hypothetical protein
MEREEFMTRNEWLVQFIFTLMVVLVAGMVIDYAARMITPSIGQENTQALSYIQLLAPTPIPAESGSPSTLGILLAFVYSMAIIFLLGVIKPPKKKRRVPVNSKF